MAPTFDPARTTEFTVDEAVDAVSADPSIAQAVLDAENARTDRDPRSTLIERVSALKPADGDSTPAPDSGAETANEPATAADLSVPPLDVEQQAPADGIAKEPIDVEPGETVTLTGDGARRADLDAGRETPDVEAVNLTQESVMAGDPMTDENRGSRPVESAHEQPGAVVSHDE